MPTADVSMGEPKGLTFGGTASQVERRLVRGIGLFTKAGNAYPHRPCFFRFNFNFPGQCAARRLGHSNGHRSSALVPVAAHEGSSHGTVLLMRLGEKGLSAEIVACRSTTPPSSPNTPKHNVPGDALRLPKTWPWMRMATPFAIEPSHGMATTSSMIPAGVSGNSFRETH